MTNAIFDPFFGDPEAVARLLAAAEKSDGTPFRPFGRVIGKTGGIDCLGETEYLMTQSHLVGEHEFSFPRTTADYQAHAIEEKMLSYFRGQSKDPQAALIVKIFAELTIPEFEDNPPDDLFMPGDIILGRQGAADRPGGIFHMMTMLRGYEFISAVPHIGVTRGHVHDTSFNKHFIAAFRARALN